MDLINEAEIRDTWSPIIESATGITESEKLGWMSTYCHNHKLYEEANIMSLNPMNLNGMGVASVGTANDTTSTGSGDKAPSLLPLAMQVAAQTIGLDLVPVVPMAGPMGLLSYLDFTYQGGSTITLSSPDYIKLTLTSGTAADMAAALGTTAVKHAGYEYIGDSRIDGKHIFKVLNDVQGTATNVAADVTVAGAQTSPAQVVTAGTVELVAAMEDHIAGFSGESVDIGATADPYSRETGESTPDKIMGLTLYSKTIAAETFQVAAAVTREQVQDLKQFGVDAVAQVETVLTNELTQSINSLILGKIGALGTTNNTEAGTAFSSSAIAVASNPTPTSIDGANRRILTLILSAANLIANRGRRGAGNFAVVSGLVASLIQSVAGYQPAPMQNTANQNAGGIYPVGSVAGVTVYTDPNRAFESGIIDVGRKGDGNGAGLVFMPYLMAESVQTIAEGTMAPKVAVKSRFALVEAGHNPETQYHTQTFTNVSI